MGAHDIQEIVDDVGTHF